MAEEKKQPKIGQPPALTQQVQNNAKDNKGKQGKFSSLDKKKKMFFIAVGVLAFVGIGAEVGSMFMGEEEIESPPIPPATAPANHPAPNPAVSRPSVAKPPMTAMSVQNPAGVQTEVASVQTTSASHSSQGRPAVPTAVPTKPAPTSVGASSPVSQRVTPPSSAGIPNTAVSRPSTLPTNPVNSGSTSSAGSENLVPPKLVGNMVQQAIQEAVNKIVAEYKEKLDKEFKEKYAKFLEQQNNPLGAPKVMTGGEEEEGEKKASVPMGEENLPALIVVKAKVITPDGRILLKTDYGDIVQGAVIMGWKVEKIDDKYVYFSRKVVKKIPVKKLVVDPNTGVKYHKTVYKKITEIQKKKIPYTVAF